MFTLKKNSLDIEYDDLHHWVAICGYTLPQTEGDIARFEKLYANYKPKYSVDDLDFECIWNNVDQFDQKHSAAIISADFSQMKMAARGLNGISQDIKEKMKNNQLEHGK